jgi:hypothetical protein
MAETAKTKLQRAMSRLAKIREGSEQTIGTAIAAVEVTGTTFGLEFLRGKSGTDNADSGERELNVGGVPVALLVGVGGHVAGFAGVGGKFASHLNNIGNGGLAAWAAQFGFQQGVKSAENGGAVQGRVAPRMMGTGYTPSAYSGNPAHAPAYVGR